MNQSLFQSSGRAVCCDSEYEENREQCSGSLKLMLESGATVLIEVEGFDPGSNTPMQDFKKLVKAAGNKKSNIHVNLEIQITEPSRFDGWTTKDYEKEIKRVETSRKRLEEQIPKLEALAARRETEL